ncbi:MATE family efflux transporter [Alsobacter sp. R-9]
MSGPGGPHDAVFTRGSTFRHVTVMSVTGAVGLTALFVVDLVSLLYISWLGDVNVTAGVGFATTVFFFSTSVNIGLMIACAASVSRALGARDRAHARRLAGSSCAWITLIAFVVGVGMLPILDPLLTWLGATGEAHAVAHRFLMISMPSNVLMGLGLSFSAVLRAVGDARRAMYVTLIGGAATAVIDPLLIFGLKLGADGAAWAVVLSRAVFCVIGYLGAVRLHDLVSPPDLKAMLEDARPLGAIAGPAVLTNVAPPVANGFMTAVISPFGEEAVAANAIILRLTPVAFCVLFALAGAVGPIFGQNLGAGLHDRVRRTLTDGLLFSLLTVLLAWAVLALGQNGVVALFHAEGETASLLRLFCTVIAGSWIFHGALFVANAAFNNLGAPLLATAFNWGKATLGTVPFALAGAHWGGAAGALVGQGLGAIVFGIAGVWAAYGSVERIIARTTARQAAAAGE